MSVTPTISEIDEQAAQTLIRQAEAIQAAAQGTVRANFIRRDILALKAAIAEKNSAKFREARAAIQVYL